MLLGFVDYEAFIFLIIKKIYIFPWRYNETEVHKKTNKSVLTIRFTCKECERVGPTGDLQLNCESFIDVFGLSCIRCTRICCKLKESAIVIISDIR